MKLAKLILIFGLINHATLSHALPEILGEGTYQLKEPTGSTDQSLDAADTQRIVQKKSLLVVDQFNQTLRTIASGSQIKRYLPDHGKGEPK
jgi:hypothetical protein